MIVVRQTLVFGNWLDQLVDEGAAKRIADRIPRLQGGLFGDVRPVGDGVSEMRIHAGPGYRVYFVRRGKTVFILLCGGDESTQTRDIQAAKSLAAELTE